MSDQLAPLLLLARSAAALRARALAEEDADMLMLASAFEEILQGRDLLEHLLGPKRKQRSRNLATQLVQRRHEGLICKTAARFFEGSAQAQAEQLHSELVRYAAGAWRREREHEKCSAPAESLKAALWSILTARDYVPSARTIRALLARSAHYSLPAESPLIRTR